VSLQLSSPESAGVVAATLERLEREAEHGTCDTGRYRCRYYAWGTGPTLVFIHGLGDDALAFALLISHLSAHFRCIAYDLPGRPNDGSRGRSKSHADLVADLLTLLDHFGERSATVCGFSFGSTVALAALHAAPDRLTHGILVAGFARRPLSWQEWLLARMAVHWGVPMRCLPMIGPVRAAMHGQPFVGKPTDLWRFFRERSDAAPIRAVAGNALLLHGTDLRPILPEISQPILIVGSVGDPLVPARYTEELAQGLPHVTRVVWTERGHEIVYSHPEELALEIAQFMLPAGGPLK
jgi:pimeloyl-ACP methyl ester carboxylesterase